MSKLDLEKSIRVCYRELYNITYNGWKRGFYSDEDKKNSEYQVNRIKYLQNELLSYHEYQIGDLVRVKSVKNETVLDDLYYIESIRYNQICTSRKPNTSDYWRSKPDSKRPEAFDYIFSFLKRTKNGKMSKIKAIEFNLGDPAVPVEKLITNH